MTPQIKQPGSERFDDGVPVMKGVKKNVIMEDVIVDSENGAGPNKSAFEKWLDQHEGRTTTLYHELELAKRLYDEAEGKQESNVPVEIMIQYLQNAPLNHGIVSWKGISVDWILQVFCETNYFKYLQEFGCQLWFVRKVCIIEFMRRHDFGSGTFIELVQSSAPEALVQEPTTYLTYAGQCSLIQFKEMLHDLKGEYIWMDMLCVDQFAWTGRAKSDELKPLRTDMLTRLSTEIQEINKTVLMLGTLDYLKDATSQAWVLWEIFNTAMSEGTNFSILLSDDGMERYLKSLDTGNADFKSIEDILGSIDASKANAPSSKDRKALLEHMAKHGFFHVNCQVTSKLRESLIETGKEYIGGDRAQDPLRTSSFAEGNVAKLLQSEGHYEEAELLFREALNKRQWLQGPDHPETFAAMHDLAGVVQDQGRLTAAEPIYRKVLRVRERVLGKSHMDTLVTMHDLASLLQRQGRFSMAEPLYREVFQKRQKLLGEDHVLTLSTMHSLAELLARQGNFSAAEPLFRELVLKQEQCMGQDHPSALLAKHGLARLLQRQGQVSDAASMYHEVLCQQKQVLGDDHPDTLRTLQNLGTMIESQGDLKEAEAVYQNVLRKQQRILGESHPDTLLTMHNLGHLFKAKGDFEKASPIYRQVLRMRQQLLGDGHPDTLLTMHNLANLLASQGNYDEAGPIYREVLRQQRRLFGQDHADTLLTMHNLANLLRDQDKYAAAEPIYQEVLRKQQRILGEDHPKTLLTMNNLAIMMQREGRFAEAESIFAEVLEKRQKVLGEVHPKTLSTRKSLALLLKNRSKDLLPEPETNSMKSAVDDFSAKEETKKARRRQTQAVPKEVDENTSPRGYTPMAGFKILGRILLASSKRSWPKAHHPLIDGPRQ